MKINTKQLSLLYVDRQKIRMFAPGFKEIEQLDLSHDSMQDLEIVNRSALQRQLDNWFEQLGFFPTYALVIFSPAVFFIHQFKKPVESEEDEDLLAFLETVPFDAVEHKIYPVGSGSICIALSKYLYEPLMDVLEDLKVKPVAYIPSAVTGVDFAKKELNAEMAASLLSNHEQLAGFSILDPEIIEEKLDPKSDFMTVKLDKKLIAMISFFVLLLGVLGVLLWQQSKSSSTVEQNVVLPPDDYQVEPTPAAVGDLQAELDASQEASLADTSLNIKIVPGFLDAEQLDSLTTFLGESFDVEIDESSTQQSARTLVVYSAEADQVVKREINQLVEDIDPDYSVQTNQSLSADEVLIIFHSQQS